MDTPQKTPNTIKGRFVLIVDGVYTAKNKPNLCWHIPRALRHLRLKEGDFVFVTKKNIVVIVDKVFRENMEDTGKSYPPVRSKVKKSQQIVLGGQAQKSK